MTTINTETWEPNPDRPGYLRYAGQVDLDTIRAGILEALGGMHWPGEDYSAAQILEWITDPNEFRRDEPTPEELCWPKRSEAAVTVLPGSNEGWHIIVLAVFRDALGCARQIFTIKFLTGQDEVWHYARQLARCFESH